MSQRGTWMAAGGRYSLAQPVADIVATLRRYGYVVGTIGNGQHLDHVPPEDHTPYSATGWPVASPTWWVHAFDIMPPPAGSGLPDLGRLGSQLVLDRTTGVPGASVIKFLNWTPAGGACRHEAWTPDHRVCPSSDTGHIHASVRSDCTHSTIAAGYDPVARARGAGLVAATPTRVAATAQGHAAGPPWPGRVLCEPATHGDDARTWQARMHERGATIAVDGWYGPKSADVCQRLQAQRGLAQDRRVGPITWAASWA